MHLLIYIFDETKEVIYNKLIKILRERTLQKLKENYKYDFIEVSIFSESISLEFYGNFTLLKTNIKYSNFLQDENLINRVKRFENKFESILNQKTFFIRLDEILIENYEEELIYGNWYDGKYEYNIFFEWLKNQDISYWKKLR